jgi:serine/threonine-protein kinase
MGARLNRDAKSAGGSPGDAELDRADLDQAPTLPNAPGSTSRQRRASDDSATTANANADAITLPGEKSGDRSGDRSGSSSASTSGSRSASNASEVLVARPSHTVARTAATELRQEEASRARAFAASALGLSAVVVLEELALDDSAAARMATLASLVVLGIVSARAWQAAADSKGYTRRIARQLGAASFFAATMATYRFGVFSPAPMLTTLAVAFFGLGEDRFVAYGFTALSGLAYAGIGSLVVAGALPDPGIVRALEASPGARYAIVLLVPLVHAATLWHARVSRRATLNAIQHSYDWYREARQREVQLDEANRDLDKLLKMNAGDPHVHVGARAGAYVLRERIGRGAMGEVYAAKHGESGGFAAVKLLHPDMQEDALLMQRFLREGEAASKLHAPNVVQIYEVGKLADGAPYLAMELLRGHDLAWHLRRRGQLSLDEVSSLVDQVAAGLEVARVAGVVHRDLKPQNLFLAQQTNALPIWKILDFGISRLTDSGGTLTKDLIVGTPGYMSPEQAGGGVTSHRSDLFSFGAVVYRALTGEPPFAAEDTPQTLYQVVYRNPIRPSALVRGLPPDVDLVLAIALAKDQSDRFDSALEMASAMKLAVRSALDPQRRLHARTLLAALPWSIGETGSGVEESEDELSLSDVEPFDEA